MFWNGVEIGDVTPIVKINYLITRHNEDNIVRWQTIIEFPVT